MIQLPQATESVEYRRLSDFQDYCVGSDGSAWSSKSGQWKRLKVIVSDGAYPSIIPRDGPRFRRYNIHTLILRLFRGPPPTGHEASHLDGNRLNWRLDNLEWETRPANNQRKTQHGTQLLGTRNHQVKLSESRVLQIRALLSSGHGVNQLARTFDVSPALISGIKNRKRWTHV